MSDAVNHPKHYGSHPSGVECITVVEHMPFNVGNAIKYLWRAGLRGAIIEDLQKAKWYVAREIQRMAGSSGDEPSSGEEKQAHVCPSLGLGSLIARLQAATSSDPAQRSTFGHLAIEAADAIESFGGIDAELERWKSRAVTAEFELQQLHAEMRRHLCSPSAATKEEPCQKGVTTGETASLPSSCPDRADRLWRALDDLVCKAAPVALGMAGCPPASLYDACVTARKIRDKEQK